MAFFKKYSEVIFWNFKRMDNVNYNFEIITTLIDGACNSKTKPHYYKPIFILIMSIIECILYDFLCRIQEHVYEKINLSDDDIKKIKNLNLPKKLKNYTDICQKHQLLGNDNIYEEISRFSEFRNRVHIQNEKQQDPLDEVELWSVNDIQLCGELLKKIIIYLCKNLPRPDSFHTQPDLDCSFPTPWNKLSLTEKKRPRPE